MKRTIFFTLTVLFALTTIFSLINSGFATENASIPTATQTSTSSSSGSGWFFCRGHRDGFGFSVIKGALKPDGWNYAPIGYVNYQAKLPTADVVGQANSMRVFRFRVDPIEGGTKIVVAGIAQVKIGEEVRHNWWFRVTARSMDDGQNGFLIQLWRPIGAEKSGGWSFGEFKPNQPATLQLNDAPFYQAQGIIAGGKIKTKL